MQNTKVITKVNPYLRLATEQDCIRLAPNLRKEDIQEIKAVTGEMPLLSLIVGLRHSDVPLVICNQKMK